MQKILFLFFLVPLGTLFSQNIPIGTWRNHSSYTQVQKIVQTENKIYAASNNGFFSFDLNEKQLQTYSKIDGLSGPYPSCMAFHVPSGALVIGYPDGYVDLIKEGVIYSIKDIETDEREENKTINHISLNASLAYLSTPFGIVTINITQNRIGESFKNIGNGGNPITIQGSAFVRDSIFIISGSEIRAASLAENLQDFNVWGNAQNGIPDAVIKEIISHQEYLYANVDQHGIYAYENGLWEKISPPELVSFQDISVSNGQLLAATSSALYLINNDLDFDLLQDQVPTINQSLYDNEQNLWLATEEGLLSNWEGSMRAYIPNGPYHESNWSAQYFNGRILITSGGYNDNYEALQNSSGFYVFDQNVWKNYNTDPVLAEIVSPEFDDITDAVFNPFDRHGYLTSFGDGILKVSPAFEFEKIDQNTPNTPLSAASVQNLTSVTYDYQGGKWFCNYGVAANEASVYVHRNDGAWETFSFNNAARFPVEILVDYNNYKWIRLAPRPNAGGIWVLDEANNRSIHLTTANNAGGLTSNLVECITLDLDGQVWVGSDNGVVVFYNPFDVFSPNGVNAGFPVFENRQLLRNQKVTCIRVDGGNRKWIGTESGVWLFSEDGGEAIFNFTAENSPLPSNLIKDIRIHEESGEVFFLTSKGVISFRGTATAAFPQFQEVKVFPNPVTPDFTGLIGISGLAENAFVKITSVSGKLAHEGRANGGMFTWDARDYNGRKVDTGIYLIFAVNESGEERYVGKIAIIK